MAPIELRSDGNEKPSNPTMKKISYLLGWFAMMIGIAVGVTCAAEAPVAAVLRADQARLAAMMAGDGAALGKLMSDELAFVHSDGRIESKADYVKNMLAGDTAYKDAKTSDVRTMEPAPGVVILIGAQQMTKRLGPSWSEIKLKFMAVWRNEGSTWRMVAWQSMRPSGNSVVPGK
ncbi:MAG: nuclear transport factor 2 family protein [Verrucomicrobia bacterium]|nr:nuclear transport factor 2 family protein [Verrucomicrobiota bacterium]